MKIRIFPEHNYKAIWHEGKTMRIALDPKKPITELRYPEFLDVKVTDHCLGACPGCYMDSKSNDPHNKNIVSKFVKYFGPMSENERPFQLAFGGGEPSSHPEFLDLMIASHKLGILPNYTTNGMWVKENKNKEELISITKNYCGGVAVSTHKHLEKYWKEAVNIYIENGIFTNLHHIISDKESVDEFLKIYKEYTGKIQYFVLLPLGKQGRSDSSFKEETWDYMCEKIDSTVKDIAFGALFHPYLINKKHNFKISIYEPHNFSGFLDLKDMVVYKSSFDLTPKFQ